MDEGMILCNYLENILSARKNEPLGTPGDRWNPELLSLLESLDTQVWEAYSLSAALAGGSLDNEASRDNILAGPLKELQSNLKHLIWQLTRVIKGDYNQRVDYLGEFSDTFNALIKQLLAKEELHREKLELQKRIMESRENELKNLIESKETYYTEITDMHEQMRILRHDMKNHFICIKTFLENGDYDEAAEYLKSMEDIIFSGDTLAYTKNYIMDIILTEKINAAKSKNIKVLTKLSIKENIDITPLDCCMIMGNALDNAIEAVEQLDEEAREIEITMLSKGEVLCIEISNPVSCIPEREGEFYRTSKKNKSSHGIGLMSIKKSVQNYQGQLVTEINGHRFILKMFLFGV